MGRRSRMTRLPLLLGIAAAGCLTAQVAAGHGSVTPDADLCIIRIGYFKAHFKVYLPETHGHRDFCEDLPAVGHSIFVMEYEHDGLANTPIDFRIVENVTGQRRFTKLQHIEQIDDLDAITVFHHPFAVQPDVFTIRHEFESPGEFVGVVTVERPDAAGVYTAVFPFEAGYTGFGWWPWLVAALVILQINYFWMSGRLRWSRKMPHGSIGPLPGRGRD